MYTAVWESDQDTPEELMMQEVWVWDVGLNQDGIHSMMRLHQFIQGLSPSIGDRTHLALTE